MYKSYSKFRQRFKESYTVDVGAGNRTGKVSGAKGKSNSVERRARRLTAIERTRANLAKNEEKLKKAENALVNQINNLKKLEQMIENAWSLEFKERYEQWYKENEVRINDIEKSIGRIKGWIIKDKRKLDSLCL